MVNNQLKYMKKKGSFAWRKTHLKKKSLLDFAMLSRSRINQV